MKKGLSIIAAVGLLLYPFAALGIDYGSQAPQTQQAPPVAQPLVREGDFAVKLAAELDLGNPTDEAVAEDVLATAGIVPTNGWLSDYPMTPEILGQLQESIAKASSEGKLPMNAEEATKGLYYIASQMNLPTPASAGNAPSQTQQAPAGTSNPSVINNYYYNQGPPVVTYYPPPPDYAYMYDWVPYPSWWVGFWFPGFFIVRNFTTVVVVTRPVVVSGAVVVTSSPAIVTNRIIDPVTRRVAVVDPVTRNGTSRVRPVTTLRTGNGRTFTTITEMRRDTGVSAPRSGTSVGSPSRSPIVTRGPYDTPAGRRGAERIYSRSVENARRFHGEGLTGGQTRRFVSPSGGPVRGEGRRFETPGSFDGTYNNERMRSEGQRFISPRYSEGQFRSPQMGEGGPSVRPFVSPGERRFSPAGTPFRSFDLPWNGGGGNGMRSFSGSGRSVRGRGLDGAFCLRVRC